MASADWKVDFSRRSSEMDKYEVQTNNTVTDKSQGFVDSLFKKVVPTEEMVILNTAQGFVPSTVRVRAGVQYRFIVVNVNETARNISFVMDAFSEHHSTYYGQLKSFYVSPKKAGIYSFVSPETSAQGRLVVQPTDNVPSVDVRMPASTEE
jgi:plastocyanin